MFGARITFLKLCWCSPLAFMKFFYTITIFPSYSEGCLSYTFLCQHFWNKCALLFLKTMVTPASEVCMWNLVNISQMWSRTSLSAIGSDQMKFITSAVPSQAQLSVIPAVAEHALSTSN